MFLRRICLAKQSWCRRSAGQRIHTARSEVVRVNGQLEVHFFHEFPPAQKRRPPKFDKTCRPPKFGKNRRTSWPVSFVLHFLLSSTDHQATTGEHFKTRQESATTQTRTSGEALRLAVVGVRFLFFFWLKFPCCSAFKWLKLSSILVFPASQVSLSFSRQVGETFERTFFSFRLKFPCSSSNKWLKLSSAFFLFLTQVSLFLEQQVVETLESIFKSIQLPFLIW